MSLPGTQPSHAFCRRSLLSCCARSFVQLSAWPDGDRGYITTLRQAQLAALRLNRTGMAVSADRSDPSGMWHPVHPPWKQDIAARLLMEAQRPLLLEDVFQCVWWALSPSPSDPLVRKRCCCGRDLPLCGLLS